jgi:hypothetical protein
VEIFLVSFFVFGLSVLGLVMAQWLRRAPIPVGCTPVNGECCQASAGAGNAGARQCDPRFAVEEG